MEGPIKRHCREDAAILKALSDCVIINVIATNLSLEDISCLARTHSRLYYAWKKHYAPLARTIELCFEQDLYQSNVYILALCASRMKPCITLAIERMFLSSIDGMEHLKDPAMVVLARNCEIDALMTIHHREAWRLRRSFRLCLHDCIVNSTETVSFDRVKKFLKNRPSDLWLFKGKLESRFHVSELAAYIHRIHERRGKEWSFGYAKTIARANEPEDVPDFLEAILRQAIEDEKNADLANLITLEPFKNHYEEVIESIFGVNSKDELIKFFGTSINDGKRKVVIAICNNWID